MATKKKTTKTTKTAPAADTRGPVKVRATCHLHEDGTTYAPGEEFETTATRAAALGTLVETID